MILGGSQIEHEPAPNRDQRTDVFADALIDEFRLVAKSEFDRYQMQASRFILLPDGARR
ncbi:hypothetical protein NKH41_27770 [Mesorhizobium sp. M1169]|uniref:hypothetical protein n=1 Tax=Mesorhizobium sp. M1169 TaxID=2957066 RepID=UPI00333BA9D2